ncbi:hypothetical protein DESC_600002 [Desulfosarcina cetonica]|nr:hypothetical protein DESC_600002 [Desulfosarcina cetonica]
MVTLRCRRLAYGIHHFIMRNAATEVAGQRMLDGIPGGVRVLIHQRLGAHQDARGAESTLKGAVVDKGLLQGMQLAGGGIRQSFNGDDPGAVTFDGQGHAGENRLAVHDHRARSAGALVATDFGSGKPQGFPEGVGQGVRWRHCAHGIADGKGVVLVVDLEVDGAPLLFRIILSGVHHLSPVGAC